MKCKFCNSKDIDVKRKIKSPHNSFFYSFYKCDICKCHFFNLDEHKYDLEELYNSLAEKSTYNEEFIKSLNKDINKVIDVGCRTGDFLMHWDDRVSKNGIELSTKSANIAKNRGLTIYQDFIENINFSGKKFDVVTCYAVLEHLENPIPIIENLINIVDKNGILVIMIPYFDSWKSKILYFLNYRWHMFSQPEHLNFYSKKFLDELMLENGFELQRTKYTSGGMFNPFAKIPLINRIFDKLMNLIDFNTPINKIPLFDHMYLYYKKVK